MTEDQQDQPTAEGPVPGPDSETSPTPVAEGPGQAIPMPPVSTPESVGAEIPAAPQQPDIVGVKAIHVLCGVKRLDGAARVDLSRQR